MTNSSLPSWLNTATPSAHSPSPQPNAPQPQPTQSARPPSLLRRAQANHTVKWVLPPNGLFLVRFDLSGLGDPLHRLIGTPLNLDANSAVHLVDRLSSDQALLGQVKDALDDAWRAYSLKGAMLLYPWSTAMREVFTAKRDEKPPATGANGDDGDNEAPPHLHNQLVLVNKEIKCLRAIDVHLIINVLARARSQVVSAGTPLALETGFLNRSYVTDDARLVRLVQATGYVEETWQ